MFLCSRLFYAAWLNENPWRNRIFIDIDFDAKPFAMKKKNLQVMLRLKRSPLTLSMTATWNIYSQCTHILGHNRIYHDIASNDRRGRKGWEGILVSLPFRLNLSDVLFFYFLCVSHKSEILWKFFQVRSSTNFIKGWNVSHFLIQFFIFHDSVSWNKTSLVDIPEDFCKLSLSLFSCLTANTF